MATLSRMFSCSLCDEGVRDKDMRQIYHIENAQEVTDGIVHAWCEDAFILSIEGK